MFCYKRFLLCVTSRTLSLTFLANICNEAGCHVGEANGAGTEGDLWAIVCRAFGHANNYMSLEVHPSPDKPSDDYRPLAYSLAWERS